MVAKAEKIVAFAAKRLRAADDRIRKACKKYSDTGGVVVLMPSRVHGLYRNREYLWENYLMVTGKDRQLEFLLMDKDEKRFDPIVFMDHKVEATMRL